MTWTDRLTGSAERCQRQHHLVAFLNRFSGL